MLSEAAVIMHAMAEGIDQGIREFREKRKMVDRYLGDGVYASYDGYHIVLDLRGQDNTTRIALEPSVFNELVRYAHDVTNEQERSGSRHGGLFVWFSLRRKQLRPRDCV